MPLSQERKRGISLERGSPLSWERGLERGVSLDREGRQSFERGVPLSWERGTPLMREGS